MTGDFPALSKVFVSERDTYLSQSLKACSMTQPQGDDGKVLFCLQVSLFVCLCLHFIGEMTGDFPVLSKAFVSERDIYLSQSLKACSMTQPQSDDGKVLFCLLCLFVHFIGEMTGDFPALSKVFFSERDIYLSVSQGLFESMIQSQSDEGKVLFVCATEWCFFVLLGRWKETSPALSKVFVSERDIYLSQSLKACSMTQPQGMMVGFCVLLRRCKRTLSRMFFNK